MCARPGSKAPWPPRVQLHSYHSALLSQARRYENKHPKLPCRKVNFALSTPNALPSSRVETEATVQGDATGSCGVLRMPAGRQPGSLGLATTQMWQQWVKRRASGMGSLGAVFDVGAGLGWGPRRGVARQSQAGGCSKRTHARHMFQNVLYARVHPGVFSVCMASSRGK